MKARSRRWRGTWTEAAVGGDTERRRRSPPGRRPMSTPDLIGPRRPWRVELDRCGSALTSGERDMGRGGALALPRPRPVCPGRRARGRAPGWRLEQAPCLEVEVGGSELNALVAFARLGGRARWVSRLAATALGRRIQAHALAHRVEVVIDWEPGGHTGVYFVERGAAPRPGEVLYERAGSAAAGLSPWRFDWPTVLAGAAGFHTTGITLALGYGPRAAALEALAAARGLGLTTDLGPYRADRFPEAADFPIREGYAW